MHGQATESDWKHLRGIKHELLEAHSRRINDRLRALLAHPDLSENEKRGQAFAILTEGDRIVAACFDDWRRSTLPLRCLALQANGLLTEEHRANLSEALRKLLART